MKRSLASTWTSLMPMCFSNVSTTCCPSPEPQQAGVDEDAGQLIADRAMNQHSGDR